MFSRHNDDERYKWRDMKEIAREAAAVERKNEEKRIPMHPRTDFLEDDLLRAIRILNAAGYIIFEDMFSNLTISRKENK